MLAAAKTFCYNEAMKEVLNVELSLRDWNNVSSVEDAEKFVRYIVEHPSTKWKDLMNKAEQHTVNHYDVLLRHSDEIYESIARAIADEDGLVIVPSDIDKE